MANGPFQNVDAGKNLERFIALQQLGDSRMFRERELDEIKKARLQQQQEALSQRFQELQARLAAQAQEKEAQRALQQSLADAKRAQMQQRIDEERRRNQEREEEQRMKREQDAALARERVRVQANEALRRLGPAAEDPGFAEKLPLIGGLFKPGGADIARQQRKALEPLAGIGVEPDVQEALQQTAAPVQEVERRTADGRIAVFDANTRQFLRYK